MDLTAYPWQADAWRLARSALERGAHALLLHGPRGTGKRAMAARLAAGHLCEAPSRDGAACAACASCRWLAAGSHPDFLAVEPPMDEEGGEKGKPGRDAAGRTRAIGVDQIRAIPDLISLTSHRHGGGKAVLIAPAESLNASAANALLKSLEEPTARTVFLLVSHRPGLLLPTVRSRCLAVGSRPPAPEAAAAWLAGQGIDDAPVRLAWSSQSPLDALAAADDPLWRRRRELAEALLTRDGDGLSAGERFRDMAPPLLLNWLSKWSFDLVVVAAGGTTRYCPDLQGPIEDLVARMRPLPMMRYHRVLLGWQRTANHPLNPRLFIEQMLLQYYAALREGLAPAHQVAPPC